MGIHLYTTESKAPDSVHLPTGFFLNSPLSILEKIYVSSCIKD
jgi:hypothetical protein